MNSMDNRRNTLMAVLLIFVVAIALYAAWILVARKTIPKEGEKAVCTADALQCPDGSWVGRSGPNCQFVCPLATSTPTTSKQTLLQTTIGQLASGLNVQILPIEVMEDSRCPINVQCIQAGTVRVLSSITNAKGESTTTLILGEPFQTKTETITLINVTPVKESGKNIAPTDYRFTFKVTKK